MICDQRKCELWDHNGCVGKYRLIVASRISSAPGEAIVAMLCARFDVARMGHESVSIPIAALSASRYNLRFRRWL